MLSIGKLAAGQANYYLEQAHGPVSRARAVSTGVDDYYLAGPEAAGDWVGAGMPLLGLGGTVGDEPLRRVLAGEHPATGAMLGRGGKGRVPGFDLTFSAPKSVSVLFGIGDDRLRDAIRDAHHRAVADAFGYVERHAAVTRRGAGGVRTVPGHGLVAAAFRHRTSRAGDPQLHTHVLVANLTLGADGRWSALDGRRLYAHAKTGGYLYEARLRAELTRELGLKWGAVRNGIADIAGVPPAVLRAFSRRRAEIDAELERHGTRSPAAARIAALETRRRKDYRVTPEQLVPEWRERAASLGLALERLPVLLGRAVPGRLDLEVEEGMLARLAAADGLTLRRSTFTRRDVIQALATEVPVGSAATAAELEAVADRFLRSDRVIVLAVGERSPGVLRRRDGSVVPLVRDERVYSTPELLALERRILDHAEGTQNARLAVVPSQWFQRAIAGRPTISGEQAEMVRRLTGDGAGVAVVVGQAGTGKTFALAAAREAWQSRGHVVIGAALARRAARELEDGAGIPSTSVAALLDQFRREPYRALPQRSVVVVDEAGMVATRQLAELVDHAARRQAKLVLVGDHRQLAEIEAGGAFRALAARLPAIELTENRRQAARWERDALALLRDGDHETALREYQERGRVTTGESVEDVRRQVVADWWEARDPDAAVMIAFRRADVADLNGRGRARALMRATGALGSDELVLDGAGFAVGDHVVLRHNDRRLGVANGERGVVAAVDAHGGGTLELRVGDRRVQLGGGYLERGGPALAHGYAITGHSAQGLTCDRTFVLVTSQASREWCYTALSRGRHENRLYAVAREPEERDEFAPAGEGRDALADALGRSTAQTLASDRERLRALSRELGDAMKAADAARWAHHRAAGDRRDLERCPPHRLRVRARARHDEALEIAHESERAAAERVDALDARVTALTACLEKERPPRDHVRGQRERTLADRARAVNDFGIDR